MEQGRSSAVRLLNRYVVARKGWGTRTPSAFLISQATIHSLSVITTQSVFLRESHVFVFGVDTESYILILTATACYSSCVLRWPFWSDQHSCYLIDRPTPMYEIAPCIGQEVIGSWCLSNVYSVVVMSDHEIGPGFFSILAWLPQKVSGVSKGPGLATSRSLLTLR